MSFEKLPRNMLLQLKRFAFGFEGSDKISKHIDFQEYINLKPGMPRIWKKRNKENET